MRPDLQPMSIGDIFDTAFDLYKRNFALFAGVTAIVHVPAQIVFGAAVLGLDLDQFDRPTRTATDVGALFVALGVMFLLGIAYHFFYLAQCGAISIAASERLLERPITIGEAYRRLRPSLLKLVFTWMVIDLILTVLSVVLIFALSILASMILGVTALAAGSGGEPATVIMTITIVLVVVLWFLAFIALLVSIAVFVTQVIVIEGNGYFDAMSRNWSLLRGRFWPPFWFSAVLAIMVFSLQLAIQGSMELILGLTVYNWLPLSHLTHQVIDQALATVVSLFLQPFMMVALTVLYFDQRIRREGFDIELALYEREREQAFAPEAGG